MVEEGGMMAGCVQAARVTHSTGRMKKNHTVSSQACDLSQCPSLINNKLGDEGCI